MNVKIQLDEMDIRNLMSSYEMFEYNWNKWNKMIMVSTASSPQLTTFRHISAPQPIVP